MLHIKEVITKAFEFFNDLYITPDECSISNVKLEEVEFIEDEESWLITIGFTDKSIVEMIPFTNKRFYKTIKIDKFGRVLSMKIRNA